MLRALTGLLLLLAPACSSAVYVQASVQCYGLGAEAAAGVKGFAVAPAPGGENPLRDRAIGRLVAEALRARGLEERGEDAAPAADAILCAVRSSVTESAQFVPPQTRIVTSYRPGHVWRYRVDEGGATSWVTVHEPGDWYPESWTSGGYTERVFTHRLELAFRDAAGRDLWRADVSAVCVSGDTLAVMRACVPMALAEYPEPSGLPGDRVFRLGDPIR